MYLCEDKKSNFFKFFAIYCQTTEKSAKLRPPSRQLSMSKLFGLHKPRPIQPLKAAIQGLSFSEKQLYLGYLKSDQIVI